MGLEFCAAAELAFARLALRALGSDVQSDGRMWWTSAPVPPVFVQAGTLSEGVVDADEVADLLRTLPGAAVFRDTFSSIDLARHGFVETHETWMLRPPGAARPPAVPGLRIIRASTPEEVTVFERTAYANMQELDVYVEGSVHPPAASAETSELHLLVGFLDDEPIATAIAVESDT